MTRSGKERREVYYSGTVQGVGFRYTVRSLAGRFELGGHVRNLPDGRVEVVVEGQPDEIGLFLHTIESEMRDYIRHKEERSGPATGRPKGFEVRF